MVGVMINGYVDIGFHVQGSAFFERNPTFPLLDQGIRSLQHRWAGQRISGVDHAARSCRGLSQRIKGTLASA